MESFYLIAALSNYYINITHKWKGKEKAGSLNNEQIEGLVWLTGKGKGGIVKSFMDNEQLIVYEVISMRGRMIPKVQGEAISFDIEVTSEGRLSEDWLYPGNSFDNQFLQQAEQTTQKEIQKLAQNAMNELQKKYKVDVAGFGEQ